MTNPGQGISPFNITPEFKNLIATPCVLEYNKMNYNKKTSPVNWLNPVIKNINASWSYK